MKLTTNNGPGNFKPGMTLLELTVVILVLLSLIGILFIGANAWKNGTDRATCVMNIRNIQQSVRSFQNLNVKSEGADFDMLTDIMGPNGYIREPSCPGGGDYEYVTQIPAKGILAVTCELAVSHNHVPQKAEDW